MWKPWCRLCKKPNKETSQTAINVLPLQPALLDKDIIHEKIMMKQKGRKSHELINVATINSICGQIGEN